MDGKARIGGWEWKNQMMYEGRVRWRRMEIERAGEGWRKMDVMRVKDNV